jgi:hypothetical protein
VVVEALRLGVPVYAFPFGLAEDIIKMQSINPESFLYEGLPVYRIEALPSMWYTGGSQAFVSPYLSLYEKVLDQARIN